MKKEYSLKSFYKIIYSLSAILGAMFVFLRIKGILLGSSEWLMNVIAMGWAILGTAFLYDALFKRLAISESGIEYRAFLQHFSLPWNEVEEIPERLSFKVLIGKSVDGKRRRLISLYHFADNPINSELGQQIKQHAPHLFEKEKSVQSADNF